MNILVIGGSNFIGWRLLETLEKSNHSVTVINRGNHQRKYPSNVSHYISDRNDYEKMRMLIGNSEYDAVFDMCGFTERDMTHTIELFGGRTKKYVFISTAATYLEPIKMPISEHHKQGIHGIWGKYGGGKLSCERMLLSAYKENRFPVVIVRPSYVYGIGNTIDRETFVFDRITKGRKILIPGCGEAVIQLGEVSDLCNALLKIAETPKGYGECYNISGNELVTLNGFVRLISAIMEKNYQSVFVNPKDYGMTDREVFPFDNSTYFTTCQKFSKEFNWLPGVSLVEGLTSAYRKWLNSSEKLPTNYEKEDIVLAKM